MKRCFLMVLFAVFTVAAYSQMFDYPIVTVDGKEYYSYAVEPKEGLFSIARKFEVSQADLHACNPNLADGLQIGQIVLVPVKWKSVDETSGDVVIHEVQPKQTLYSLSKQYKVAIDTILKYNPELKDGLKIGQKLRIPKEKMPLKAQSAAMSEMQASTIKYTVQKHETLYSISRKYGVSVEELVETNNISSAIKIGDELLIPQPKPAQKTVPEPVVVQPDTVPQPQNNAEELPAPMPSQPDTVAQPTFVQHREGALKVAVLMPFMLKTPYIDSSVNYFWEFYRGMLIGLERVKNEGISVELHVYDIEKALESLDSVLRLPELAGMDLIVGPAYANQVEVVATYAQQHRIPVLVPFTSKFDVDTNAYVLQFNPSVDRVLPRVAQVLLQRFENQEFVIARTSDAHDKANALADELTKKLYAAGKSYQEFYLSADNVDTLRAVVGNNRTVLLLATQRTDVASAILPKIIELRLPFLQIVGFEDWKNLTTSYDGLYYFSLFNKKNTDAYETAFKNWFGEHVVLSEPHYDLIGYDVINYMARALTIDRQHPTEAFGTFEYQGLQSDFVFEQVPDNHWVNFNWYLFGYYNGRLNDVK